MQLHKLHKHASELEWSGGGRGRAEAEGVGGSQRWVEKGKGGCTMTSAYILQQMMMMMNQIFILCEAHDLC